MGDTLSQTFEVFKKKKKRCWLKLQLGLLYNSQSKNIKLTWENTSEKKNYNNHHHHQKWLLQVTWSGWTSNERYCNLNACPSYEPLHLKCALTVTSAITLWQSDWHFQACHSILMPAIKECNHFKHQIWIKSHYRLVSKVQTWPYWPGQISFLSP